MRYFIIRAHDVIMMHPTQDLYDGINLTKGLENISTLSIYQARYFVHKRYGSIVDRWSMSVITEDSLERFVLREIEPVWTILS